MEESRILLSITKDESGEVKKAVEQKCAEYGIKAVIVSSVQEAGELLLEDEKYVSVAICIADDEESVKAIMKYLELIHDYVLQQPAL